MGKFSPPPPPPVDKMGCWEFSYCFRRKVEGSITKMVEKKRKEAYILLQCREIERMKERRSLHKNVKGSPTGVQRASLLRCLCLLLLMPWLIQRRVISEVSEGNSFFFFNFLFYIGIQLINNVVRVSGARQRSSAVHIHVSIPPPTSPPTQAASSR